MNGGMGARVDQAETVSRFEASNWDAVSTCAPFGKLYPVLSRYSGSQFPKQARWGNCIPVWAGIPGHSFR